MCADAAQAMRDGWFHTGDYVSAGADDLLYFFDRKKSIVRRSAGGSTLAGYARTRTSRPSGDWTRQRAQNFHIGAVLAATISYRALALSQPRAKIDM